MKFGEIAVDEAVGAILAHGVRAGGKVFKKGHLLSADDLALLRAAGHSRVVGARLEPGDVGEDAAAAAVAQAVAGEGVSLSAAFTGRCNLFAGRRGVVVFDRERLDRLNLVDEAVTIAAVAPFEAVEPRQMIATIKIIPFAAPQSVVDRCAGVAAEGGPLMRVAPFRRLAVALVLTGLPETKERMLDKAAEAVRLRVERLGGRLIGEHRCPHETGAVAEALSAAIADRADMVLISGASAITDRRDVIPAGIERAGGRIDHFGMPVDPGNLLLLARHGRVPVLGLPGCARSPKLNGFDWVLTRLAAGVEVGRDDVMRMGAGGLLQEIRSRPLPRAEAASPPPPTAAARRRPRVFAVVLAAGQSRRMGGTNKLLTEVDGIPMVARVVDGVLKTGIACVVVTGFEDERVKAALAGRPVAFVFNPDHAEGLSTSLRCGIAALPAETEAALVCLGDMPDVGSEHIEKLIAAFDPDEGRAICVPTYRGKQGNPVLFAARFFPEMKAISGDIGAKPLIGEHAEVVSEVEMDDRGVLLDLDTPDALARRVSSG